MQFENLAGLTIVSETDALLVNGGHGRGRSSSGGDSSDNHQKGQVNVDVTGNNDTVIVIVDSLNGSFDSSKGGRGRRG
jgi:hypothetical protein